MQPWDGLVTQIGITGLFEAPEVGFVICSKCGAQIKADREWCLRCHEPLVAFKKQNILPSWVQALGGGTLIFAVVGIAAVGVLVYLSFDSGDSQPDAAIRRASPQQATAAAASVRTPAQQQTQGHIEQVTFVDAPRRASMSVDGQPADTRTRLEEALERDPRNAEILNNLGMTLEHLGFVDSAIARFSAAVAVDPRNWIYHFNVAHAASLQQNWNRAASEYAASLEIFPDNYPAQYNLAVARHLSSNEPEAIKAFERAIQMAPGDPAAHLSLALSLEASGRTDDAVSEYRKYLQMVPTARDAAAVNARIVALGHNS